MLKSFPLQLSSIAVSLQEIQRSKKFQLSKPKKVFNCQSEKNASIMPFVHLHSEHIISDLFKREKGFKTPYKKPVKIKRKSPEN